MKRVAAEQQLILLSARRRALREAAQPEIEKLGSEVDWEDLAERLRFRRLLATLGPRILELADDVASEGFGAAVDEAIIAGHRQGAFLELISLRLLVMLAEADIRAAPLKGPRLSESLYGDPGRRLSTDIDLLIPPECLYSAAEVVRELGYVNAIDHMEPDGLPLLHFALPHEKGALPPVELHWRIHWYERRFARERLLPLSVDSTGTWRPEPADELAALLLFYARDGFIDLRLATDLSAWWDAYGERLPQGALSDVLRMYPQLSHVISVAAQVSEKVVGLPAKHLIGGVPKLRFRDRLAARLANPNPNRSQPQLYADRGLIDGLLTPSKGFGAFVRRQLLPTKEVRQQQAGHAHRETPRSSIGRFVGVLARYGLSMTRLLRPRETLR